LNRVMLPEKVLDTGKYKNKRAMMALMSLTCI
jgi:hypothetical protein